MLGISRSGPAGQYLPAARYAVRMRRREQAGGKFAFVTDPAGHGSHVTGTDQAPPPPLELFSSFAICTRLGISITPPITLHPQAPPVYTRSQTPRRSPKVPVCEFPLPNPDGLTGAMGRGTGLLARWRRVIIGVQFLNPVEYLLLFFGPARHLPGKLFFGARTRDGQRKNNHLL